MIRPTLLALALFSVINSASAEPAAPLPHSPGAPYAATGLADRIVLTPGADPAREMAVTFRTDTRQQTSQLQLAPAPSPVPAQSPAPVPRYPRPLLPGLRPLPLGRLAGIHR